MKYFDTHAHIIKEYYSDKERRELLEKAFDDGMEYVLIPGTTREDTLEIVNYKTEKVLIAAGVHPSDAYDLSVVDFFKDLDMSLFTAIGEIGLDTYHDTNPDLEIQIDVFKKQLDIAKNNNLPVIIHNRETTQDIYNIISSEKYKDLTYIMHSFAQGPEEASMLMALDVYFSFSGIVTFKNAQAVRDALMIVPIDRILVETDSPFLTPSPHRGKTNYPEYTRLTIKKIAETRKIELEEMADIIFENSKRVFNL